MSFNGSGTYNRPLPPWAQDKITNPNIIASRMDVDADAVATALSNTICRDGQSTIVADIDLNNHRLKGVAVAAVGSDAMSLDASDGRYWQATNATFSATPQGGYLKLPNGFILQWIRTPFTGLSDVNLAWPTTFPSQVLSVVGQIETSDGSAASLYALKVQNLSASGLIARVRYAANGGTVDISTGTTVNIMAVGF